MKLNLDTLPAGSSDLEIDEVHALDPDDASAGEVVAQGVLQVTNTESRVLVAGALDIRGIAMCDRCLANYDLCYEAGVDLQIIRSSLPSPDDGAETWVHHQTHGELELRDAIFETLMLAMPIKRICREDCLGLCVHCGANRNQDPCDCNQEIVDPRWDGLPT